MPKILFLANSDRHIRLCHIPYMRLYKRNGYVVHVATNTNQKIDECDKKKDIGMCRNPFSLKNLSSFFKLRKLIKKEKYDIISCHTPIGGVLGRISSIGLKNKPLIFYTVHGFHFYKGSSKISWIIYYPIEKFLSRFTDLIITMNDEDYKIASNKFHTKVYKTSGIGLDEKRLKLSKQNIKKELNIENKYVVTYIAEISKRKNQIEFLKVLENHKVQDDIVFLLVGDSNIDNFEEIVNKYKNVIYVGFVNNVGDYINISDLIISPSRQEGLPQNILEAMYFNKTIVATNIRGVRDLINNKNGYLVDDIDELIDTVVKIKNKKMTKKINNDISKYKIENVLKEYKGIVNKHLNMNIK